MGDRRMISRTVVDSARFLKMPATSQNLYFHLVVNADDDGIVEAYKVMAMCKANEDDLRVLVGKQFVQILNEDLVTYIIHWREMNVLRADRKTDSIYKNLLLQVNPDVELLEKKERSDLKKKQKNKCQSVDGPRTAQHNLIQSSLIESKSTQENLREDKSINPSIDTADTDESNGEMDGSMNIDNQNSEYRNIVANNIHLDWLKDAASTHGEKEVLMVDEIYETICDIVCNPRDKVTIKNTDYPWTSVKSQLLKLNYQHIANILNRIVDADLKIKNMNAYLISTLYTESMSGVLAEEAELHDDYLKYLRGQPY